MLYKARNNVIKFYDDYSSMVSEARHEASKGTGIKILTTKQMLYRLAIALAQVKVDSNSENILHESRKLFILCVNQKKCLKKYTITELSQCKYKNGYYIYKLRK